MKPKYNPASPKTYVKKSLHYAIQFIVDEDEHNISGVESFLVEPCGLGDESFYVTIYAAVIWTSDGLLVVHPGQWITMNEETAEIEKWDEDDFEQYFEAND